MVFDEDQSVYGIADSVLLNPVNEENFIKNLNHRFLKSRIFTAISDVVVVVNPYKDIPELYTDKQKKLYAGGEYWENPPHLYSIAEQAYKTVKRYGRDTCIVISGESGSGKTESSKIIMQYISSVTQGKNQSEVDRIKRVLLKNNVVLEAFGNAQTTRNDNSSRFGKYMDICFNYNTDCNGGIINTYLLEKTRVVFQQPGERNFHIFYQLLSGAKPNLLTNLGLSKTREYKILTNGNRKMIKSSDSGEFNKVREALKFSGIDEATEHSIFSILATVILIGELTFHENEGSVCISDRELANKIAQLLNINHQDFELALVSRKVRAGVDVIETSHSKEVAEYGCLALARTVYDRLFAVLVELINKNISCPPSQRQAAIGVLDIYGFEILGKNGFEQFCINYCNEKLQQLFIQLVLKQEQEEYKREGIPWRDIAYFNNKIICELIEGPLLGTLDDMRLRNTNTMNKKPLDDLLIEAYDSNIKLKNSAYKSRQIDQAAKHLERFVDFQIQHYAGPVIYNCKGFNQCNRDELWFDFKKVISESRNPIVAALFPEGQNSGAQKRPQSTGTIFKLSMQDLVKSLSQKQPYYVRCIKPNEKKAPMTFEYDSVKHQVAYLGLIENVRVRRAGYAYRVTYDYFVNRFKLLNKQTWPKINSFSNSGSTMRNATELILGKARDECKFGKTKLFIKSPETILQFEADRRERIKDYIVPLIQRVIRGGLARIRARKIRAARLISGIYRKYKLKSYIGEMNAIFKETERINQNQGIWKALEYGTNNWPKAPLMLRGLSNQFLRYFRGWCGNQVLRTIHKDELPEARKRAIAYEFLEGKRKVQTGIRKWKRDYGYFEKIYFQTSFGSILSCFQNDLSCRSLQL